MDSLFRFFRKLNILVSREKFNRELEEEMAFHRDQAEGERRSKECCRKLFVMPPKGTLAMKRS